MVKYDLVKNKNNMIWMLNFVNKSTCRYRHIKQQKDIERYMESEKNKNKIKLL